MIRSPIGLSLQQEQILDVKRVTVSFCIRSIKKIMICLMSTQFIAEFQGHTIEMIIQLTDI